jgi:hypothetical protein
MKTISRKQSHTSMPAAPTPTSEAPTVSEIDTGLIEILTMHVGCWRPPININITPR